MQRHTFIDDLEFRNYLGLDIDYLFDSIQRYIETQKEPNASLIKLVGAAYVQIAQSHDLTHAQKLLSILNNCVKNPIYNTDYFDHFTNCTQRVINEAITSDLKRLTL